MIVLTTIMYQNNIVLAQTSDVFIIIKPAK